MTPTRPLRTTWRQILQTMAELQRTDVICFGGTPITGEDACVIVDTGELDEDEDVPRVALADGLSCCLTQRQVQSVLDNLRMQGVDLTPENAFRALDYFFENDAFLDLGK